ncbi:hypothetical protein RHMOL_Rhmol02G0136100 [Rhododendron molle]|uniref:Uncharacterized protein n=1 Tax=Rhododendron molle TaxID=49168 RepID=A0ACC0PS49_RHOML|nr:hypothetical protein RHMOL_Rhmol02G0136100 [Rhododendron molle]
MADVRARFNIPDNVASTLACKDAIRESFDNGTLYIPIVAVVEGEIRFPLAPLLCQVLSHYRLSPMQMSPNFVQVVMGINALNEMLGMSLGRYDIHYLYSMSKTKNGLTYYLKSRD